MKKLIAFLVIFSAGCSASGPVKINPINPSSQNLNQNNNDSLQKIDLEVGQILQVESKVYLKDGKSTSEVVWQSADEKIVQVNSQGKITGISAGTTFVNISAKEDSLQNNKLQITVKAPPGRPAFLNPVTIPSGISSINIPASSSPATVTPTNSPVPSKPAENKTFLRISTFDVNNNPLENVDIKASSQNQKANWSFAKNVPEGYVLLNDVPDSSLIDVSISKSGWTTRKRSFVNKGGGKSAADPVVLNFGGNDEKDKTFAIHNEPEINRVLINNLEISSYTGNKENLDYSRLPLITDNGIKVKTSIRNITLVFSEPVDKESVEESLQLISQTDSSGNNISYSKEFGISFNWYNNNQSVILSLNATPLADQAYRLQFTKGFSDIDNNFSLQGKYIYFSNQEDTIDYLNILVDK